MEEPLGLRKIAQLSECSVAEVWRQVRKMERMNIVIGRRRGKYKRYLLNRGNPLANALIDLTSSLQNYSWVIGKSIEEALHELDGIIYQGCLPSNATLGI